MHTIRAKHALTASGWQSRVAINVNNDGLIVSIERDQEPNAQGVGILLPAPTNLHSHAFQRAQTGMTEIRGDDPTDNFWSWRKLMYEFLQYLTPEDVEAITAFAQMEMLEAGFSAVAEFHYLHHQADGTPYDNPAELTERVLAATVTTGIGLTLLPVMYEQGGCDGRALQQAQCRFGNTIDQFTALLESATNSLARLPDDSRIGVAPHSLRAVSRDSLSRITALMPDNPLHIHIAEQQAEVAEVIQAYGSRPVEWLYEHYDVDSRWCLIHATHMNSAERESVARSGAVVGLCPLTEANLGDGIFDVGEFLEYNGVFGIGTDANTELSVSQELRALEYSQRLNSQNRAVIANQDLSCGRSLWQHAATGGATATGRKSGVIAPGQLADLVALDDDHINLTGKQGDMLIDSFIFAGNDSMITDVWSAGRHMVQSGRHSQRDNIEAAYRKSMSQLLKRILH